jgi:cation:H+ antiporter
MNLILLFDSVMIILGLIALWRGGDLVVRYAVQVASAYNVTTFFIGFIVLALAADIPEISVAIISAFKGVSEVSAGDIIGANFTDIAMVIGITLLLAGRSIEIKKSESKKLVGLLALATIVMIAIMSIGTLTKIHGVVLIAIYAASIAWVWTQRHNHDLVDDHGAAAPVVNVIQLSSAERMQLGLKLLLSFLLVMGASACAIHFAIDLATLLALPLETVGATIFAVGTSLPELSLSLNALRRKEYGLAIGPTLGTVLEQTTLVLGILTVFSDKPVNMIGLRGASIFMFLSFFVMGYALLSKRQAGRGTGATLVTLFFAYLAYQFMSSGVL